MPHRSYELVCPIAGLLVGKTADVECTPHHFPCPYNRPEVQSSPIHLMGLRKGSSLPWETPPPAPAASASVGSFDTSRKWETKLPRAHTDSSWCLFAVCSPHVQAAPPGRKRQAGRSQLLPPGPPLHSRPLRAARERCRYVLCLSVTTVLSQTRKKPLCAESHPEMLAKPKQVTANKVTSFRSSSQKGRCCTPFPPVTAPWVVRKHFILDRGYGKCTSPF